MQGACGQLASTCLQGSLGAAGSKPFYAHKAAHAPSSPPPPPPQVTGLDMSPYFLAVAELRERQLGGGGGCAWGGGRGAGEGQGRGRSG